MLEYQTRIQAVLESSFENLDVPERLNQAMRYSTLSGGKRFRALLVYASGLAVDAPLDKLDSVAAALECIHAYSLIHDDYLPWMTTTYAEASPPATLSLTMPPPFLLVMPYKRWRLNY